ncbi:hypothetical protein PHISCL_08497 [Aspergillus sclerotialis]|uniref:Uncharacterized protein n=1 Tax=Aspergillus sclerotialis TaxID=2070753 RepID=A0A3A2ZIK6_9EURO|nr:hypothetical protein PHISCL_08497 [Aspergillus sclerotialis]
MKFAAALTLAAGASAVAVERGHGDDKCCFKLEANGGVSGPAGQLGDGQVRVGGKFPPGHWCLENGGINDDKGRGCILTEPTTQFQCDTGASATTGFSVNSNGMLEYHGSTKFIACNSGDGYNIYTKPDMDDVTGCVDVTLTADGCRPPQSTCDVTKTHTVEVTNHQTAGVTVTETETADVTNTAAVTVTETADVTNTAAVTVTETAAVTSTADVTQTHTVDKINTHTVAVTVTQTVETCAPPPPPPETSSQAPPPPPPETTTQAPPPPPATSTPKPTTLHPTTTKSQPGCPTDLSGNYEYPHLIVPVDSSQPNKAKGTSYFGEVSDTISTIFDFDIPAKDSGKTCSLIFLFPKQEDLETSSFTFSGDGKIDVSKLQSPATKKTTYSNAPGVAQDYGTTTVAPGNSYLIATFDCPANQRVGFEVSNAGSTNLRYFQDYNPSP